jgi:hypothetical protein
MSIWVLLWYHFNTTYILILWLQLWCYTSIKITPINMMSYPLLLRSSFVDECLRLLVAELFGETWQNETPVHRTWQPSSSISPRWVPEYHGGIRWVLRGVYRVYTGYHISITWVLQRKLHVVNSSLCFCAFDRDAQSLFSVALIRRSSVRHSHQFFPVAIWSFRIYHRCDCRSERSSDPRAWLRTWSFGRSDRIGDQRSGWM